MPNIYMSLKSNWTNQGQKKKKTPKALLNTKISPLRKEVSRLQDAEEQHSEKETAAIEHL